MRPRKKVKLEDIAKKLDVSIVTVSNALSGRRGVSDQLREEIIRTAEEMGYEAGRKKERRNAGRKKVLAVCFENAEGSVPADVRTSLKALREASEEKDLKFQYHSYERLPGGGFRLRRGQDEWDVDGLVALGEMETVDLNGFRQLFHVPIVGYGFFNAEVPLDYIFDDGFHGMAEMLRYVYMNGAKSAALVMPDVRRMQYTDRMLGFAYGEMMAGTLPMDSEKALDFSQRTSMTHILTSIREGAVPDAILCADDYTAVRVMERLKREGLQVPEDVSVTGYRRTSERPDAPELTSFEADEAVLASKCLDILMKRMNGKTDTEGARMILGSVYEGSTVRKNVS